MGFTDWVDQESPLAGNSGTGNHRPDLPISGGVIALILVGTFLLLRQTPLSPSRPSIGEPVSDVALASAPARLWEDPFAAVDRHRREVGAGSESAETPITGLFNGKQGAITAVGVMVPGGPYDEQAEWRLRSRYAALSALSVLGYEPEDPEHLRYFSFEALPRSIEPLDLTVPCEWLKKRDGDEGWLLLLWLDDDAFYPTPLGNITKLAGELAEHAALLELKILGPYGSTNLWTMAEEVEKQTRSRTTSDQLSPIQIYSPSATIADEYLPGFAKGYLYLESSLQYWSGNKRSKFFRTIRTDLELAGELVPELRRRGVVSGKSHIALVSEWDTQYGRALPCAFIYELHGLDLRRCLESTDDDPEWIHRFSYLRGLDGQLPADSPTQDQRDDKRQRPARDEPGDGTSIERPEGRRRLDYLRRLADQIQRLDTDQRLEAIGVLGSDVYDKLLVLQALRRRFPHVLFFTTDLDASLLHPAEYQATRNLIVVSNFGLRLSPCLQRNIPAFRDNYQTSLFFSMQLALDPAFAGLDQDAIKKLLKQARIFEIGRNGAYDLSLGTAETTDEPTCRREILEHRASLHPRVERLSWKDLLVVTGVLVALLILLGLYMRTYRDIRPGDELAARRLKARSLFGSLLLAGTAILFVLVICQQVEGEPFSLFEGISIWPSLFLRYFAAALTVYLLIAGWLKINEKDGSLFREYISFPRPRSRKKTRRGAAISRQGSWKKVWRRFGRYVRFLWYYWGQTLFGPSPRRNGKDHGESTAATLLREYRRRSRLVSRLSRILPIWGFYVALCFLLVQIFGAPNAPYRGAISGITNIVVTVVAVLLLTFLIFCVVDATRLSVWLTRELGRAQWPEATKRHFEKKLKVRRDLLDEWLDIRAIAEHSTAVGRLVYFPVVIVILMIASRSRYLDNWDFPMGLGIVISLAVAWPIACAVVLRRAAERARSIAVDRYRTALLRASGREDRRSESQIRLLLEWIQGLRQGSFVSFSQQPWVRALALLLGGGGSLIFLEYFVWLD